MQHRLESCVLIRAGYLNRTTAQRFCCNDYEVQVDMRGSILTGPAPVCRVLCASPDHHGCRKVGFARMEGFLGLTLLHVLVTLQGSRRGEKERIGRRNPHFTFDLHCSS